MPKKRRRLSDYSSRRATFEATFRGYSSDSRKGTTLLFGTITDLETGHVISDHQWFHEGRRLEALGDLDVGAKIRFDARAKRYRKGRNKAKSDWKLAWPTKLKRG
ncbi:MAG: hypothetical protein RIM72_16255 [Alphaproteobacteria bacterium]|jgi:hypothetical protein